MICTIRVPSLKDLCYSCETQSSFYPLGEVDRAFDTLSVIMNISIFD